MNDSTLQNEILKRCGKVEGLEALSDGQPHMEDNLDAEDIDDSDIPLRDVVQAAVGLEISDAGDDLYTVAETACTEDGEIQPVTVEEDIWAYDFAE